MASQPSSDSELKNMQLVFQNGLWKNMGQKWEVLIPSVNLWKLSKTNQGGQSSETSVNPFQTLVVRRWRYLQFEIAVLSGDYSNTIDRSRCKPRFRKLLSHLSVHSK